MLAGRGDQVEVSVMVDQQQPAGAYIEEFLTAGRQPIQELDDIEVSDDGVAQLHEHLPNPAVRGDHSAVPPASSFFRFPGASRSLSTGPLSAEPLSAKSLLVESLPVGLNRRRRARTST